MRFVLLTIIVVLILALLGWVTFSNDGSRSTINFEKQEMQKDTEEAVEDVKDAFRETKESIQHEDETEFVPNPP